MLALLEMLLKLLGRSPIFRMSLPQKESQNFRNRQMLIRFSQT
jgi:hypothetical protein